MLKRSATKITDSSKKQTGRPRRELIRSVQNCRTRTAKTFRVLFFQLNTDGRQGRRSTIKDAENIGGAQKELHILKLKIVCY